jgi:hypothetical protein
VQLAGDLAGRADGSDTEIHLEAKLNFDLQAKSITWFAATIQEKRKISETQPGLEVTARLRLAVQRKAESIPELADTALPATFIQQSPTSELVRFISAEGGFEVLCDRRWRVIVDRYDATILRLFDDQTLVAQAVISPLPDGPPGKQLSLQSLQEDVQESLSQHTGQIVESTEGQTDAGLRVLRISAAGIVSDVSMQWVYYHLSNEDGRRAGITVTVQTDLIEEFGDHDAAIVETFRFRPATTEPSAEGATEPTSSDSPESSGDVK